MAGSQYDPDLTNNEDTLVLTAQTIVAIPTLDDPGLWILVLLLGGFGASSIASRRRQQF